MPHQAADQSVALLGTHLSFSVPAFLKHGSEGAIREAGDQHFAFPGASISLDEPTTAVNIENVTMCCKPHIVAHTTERVGHTTKRSCLQSAQCRQCANSVRNKTLKHTDAMCYHTTTAELHVEVQM